MKNFNKSVNEALITVPLEKQPDWIAKKKAEEDRIAASRKEKQFASVFDEVDNIEHMFSIAIKTALPGVFGNLSSGKQPVHMEEYNKLEAYQDDEIETSDFVVTLTEQSGRYCVKIVFTTASYEDSFLTTEGKSSTKAAAKASEYLNVNTLSEMIKEAYAKIEKVVDKCFDHYTFDDLSDINPMDWQFIEAGRKGDLTEGSINIGDDVRYVWLTSIGDCSKSLYDKLKAHLGKIGRVVKRDEDTEGMYIVRFDDGFTFWFYPDELEDCERSFKIAVNESTKKESTLNEAALTNHRDFWIAIGNLLSCGKMTGTEKEFSRTITYPKIAYHMNIDEIDEEVTLYNIKIEQNWDYDGSSGKPVTTVYFKWNWGTNEVNDDKMVNSSFVKLGRYANFYEYTDNPDKLKECMLDDILTEIASTIVEEN